MTRPAKEAVAQPKARSDDEQKQQREAACQRIVSLADCKRHSGHGPGTEHGTRGVDRAGGEHDGLAAAVQQVHGRLGSRQGGANQRFDTVACGRRHIALGRAALMRGKGVGNETAAGVPETAFDARCVVECRVEHRRHEDRVHSVVRGLKRARVSRLERGAGVAGETHGPAGLGFRSQLVDAVQDHAERDAQRQREKP